MTLHNKIQYSFHSELVSGSVMILHSFYCKARIEFWGIFVMLGSSALRNALRVHLCKAPNEEDRKENNS